MPAAPLIYTLDFETDPFEHNQQVAPFSACIYDGEKAYTFWGDDCVEQLVKRMETLPKGLVYAHNGGRFDFFWLMKYADAARKDKCVIIGNRIVKFDLYTGHELRDSFKLFPFALDKYKKTEVDYNFFYPCMREQFRAYITDYLIDDCVNLYELVSAYFETFGESLTIGTTAFKELKSIYDVGPELNPAWDKHLREKYYYGGRVERYKTGVFDGTFRVYDINSAYPAAMRDYLHPVGLPHFGYSISEKTSFVKTQGRNHGAFPARTDEGLTFGVKYGTFHTTIHEFNTAVELRRFIPSKILQTIDFDRHLTFEEFITKFYNLRLSAAATGDELHKLMYKFLLNNSYGKFAINPDNYKDYCILKQWEDIPHCTCTVRRCICGKWRAVLIIPEQEIVMYARPSKTVRRMNIATGASITGATRSMLMSGLHGAKNPMYCDTDSLICEDLAGVNMDGKELGAWKLEAQGDKLAIAGRKMYALWSGKECLKSASKGVNLQPDEILRVASGEKLVYNQAAPVFRLNGTVDFISREVRIT